MSNCPSHDWDRYYAMEEQANMVDDDYDEAFKAGLRRAGELLWEHEHYDAAAVIRGELNRIMRGNADVPVNAFDGGVE